MPLSLSNLGFILKNRLGIWRAANNWVLFSKNNNNTPWGSVSVGEEKELIRLTKLVADDPGPIVEVGTLFGLTTQLLACEKAANQKLITIDNFSWNPFSMSASSHEEFTRRILRHSIMHQQTTLFAGTAEDFYKSYDGIRPAMMFIDASHKYEWVKKDIEWAMEQKVPVISGHDYNEATPCVIKAVDELLGKDIHISESVWSWVSKP